MVIYRFPPESNEGDSSKKKSSNKQPGKMPDFIYVDDVSSQHENWESSGREAPVSGGFTNTSQAGYPLFLRFLTLLAASFLTVWVGVLIILFLIATAIAIVLLFKSPSAIQTMKKLWRGIGSSSAYALALFVATLNPAFGFGMFALYALQSGENAKETPFGKMFQDRF